MNLKYPIEFVHTLSVDEVIKTLETNAQQGIGSAEAATRTAQFDANVYTAQKQKSSEANTHTMVFLFLISANIFLTLVNRSFFYSVFTTLKYQNNLVLLIISITIALTTLLIYLKPLASFFRFNHLNLSQSLMAIVAGFATVIWYEAVKWRKRVKALNN